MQTNWRITDTSDGSTVSGYTIAIANGNYVFSGLSAGTFDVDFYDEANSKDIIAVGGVYYDSNKLTVTLT